MRAAEVAMAGRRAIPSPASVKVFLLRFLFSHGRFHANSHTMKKMRVGNPFPHLFHLVFSA